MSYLGTVSRPAVNSIIPDNSITAAKIVDGAIVAADIASSVHSGHVLQMKKGQYTTQTSIGSTPTKIIEVSLTAKRANSTWYGAWNFTCGQYTDAQGWNLYASISTTTPDYSSSAQIWNSCASPNYACMIEGNDLGNISSAHETGYSFGSTSGDLSTTASGSQGGSFAEGAVVLCAFWVRGNSTVYVNRCQNRATEHETGITSLTVWEIAT